MTKLNSLANVFARDFSLSDIDLLVKNGKASYGNKNGNTMIFADLDDCAEYLAWYYDYSR